MKHSNYQPIMISELPQQNYNKKNYNYLIVKLNYKEINKVNNKQNYQNLNLKPN